MINETFCKECGSLMYLRENKYGKYWQCTSYPDCRNVELFKIEDELFGYEQLTNKDFGLSDI